jgi:hypothetical protein
MLWVKDDGLAGRIGVVVLEEVHFEFNPQNIGYFCIEIVHRNKFLAE